MENFKFVELQIKITSLQDEAKCIRRKSELVLSEIAKVKEKNLARGTEYEKTHYWRYVSLRNHRTGVVRKEQQSAFLAYAFLRGKTYKEVERTTKSEPNWKRVVEIVNKFWGEDNHLSKGKTRFHTADIDNWKKGLLKFDCKLGGFVSVTQTPVASC